jgi:hypothetical protein
MAIWIVKATWMEDEAEVSEQWEVNASTAHDAVREVTTHIRFQPHHFEARQRTYQAEGDGGEAELQPGHARRIPPC